MGAAQRRHDVEESRLQPVSGQPGGPNEGTGRQCVRLRAGNAAVGVHRQPQLITTAPIVQQTIGLSIISSSGTGPRVSQNGPKPSPH